MANDDSLLPTTYCTLPVRSPDGDYRIALGRGLIDRLGELASEAGLGRRAAVVTDANVAPLYSNRVVSSLEKAGFEASIIVVPPGEEHKDLHTVGVLVEAFAGCGLDRSGWVLALG